MLKTIIIDDHQDSLDYLRGLVTTCKDLELKGEATTWLEANQIINQCPPNIIFIDTSLFDGNALEELNSLHDRRRPYQVVITSFNADYALDAIKSKVNDYLLKPINTQQFNRAVSQIVSDHFFVSKSNYYLQFDEIFYITSKLNYVEIHTMEGKIIERNTLSSLEQTLPAIIFKRIHRSYIVNARMISRLTRTLVFMKNGASLPITVSKKDLGTLFF
ncbi:MAG: LytTR family DNA-binding domain-containing protein [Cyclobacteriaceae bacterium]